MNEPSPLAAVIWYLVCVLVYGLVTVAALVCRKGHEALKRTGVRGKDRHVER